eukprot:g73468.t1
MRRSRKGDLVSKDVNFNFSLLAAILALCKKVFGKELPKEHHYISGFGRAISGNSVSQEFCVTLSRSRFPRSIRPRTPSTKNKERKKRQLVQ